MSSWSASVTDKANNVKAQAGVMANVPLGVRSALNELMQPFGSTKTHALVASGTLNSDGTGSVSIVITVT